MICDDAKSSGISFSKTCKLLQISLRRVERWKKRGILTDRNPGPANAPHALLPEEHEAILTMVHDEEYVNDSYRVLAAKGADAGLFHVSASSVYKVMRVRELTADRSGRAIKKGASTPPERKEINGPNQRWCWDISYLPTNVKGIFLYLFVLLDEYSRKVIAWRISWRMTHKEGMELIQEGLEKEGLEDIDVSLPDLINDRGSQMKAKPFMRMCNDLGIDQKFARPRTPNDNPFIESLFSIVKTDHRYPGAFTDDIAAITYFTYWFDDYNHSRLHGGIKMVTPQQRHSGEDKRIIRKRNIGLAEARKNRIIKNKERKNRKLADILCVV